jgi:hypothetical protein
LILELSQALLDNSTPVVFLVGVTSKSWTSCIMSNLAAAVQFDNVYYPGLPLFFAILYYMAGFQTDALL